MIKNCTLAALAVLAVPTAAQAQSSATGARIELILGIDDFKDNFGSDSDVFNPEKDRDLDAAIGANVGYDFLQSGSVSAGVDLEFLYATARKPVFISGTRNGDQKFGTEVYGGGRVTFAVSPSFSVVGKLGYTALDTSFTADALKFRNTENLNGIRGAVGVQYTGSDEDRTYYGLEARYTDYEKGLTRKGLMLVVGHRF